MKYMLMMNTPGGESSEAIAEKGKSPPRQRSRISSGPRLERRGRRSASLDR